MSNADFNLWYSCGLDLKASYSLGLCHVFTALVVLATASYKFIAMSTFALEAFGVAYLLLPTTVFFNARELSSGKGGITCAISSSSVLSNKSPARSYKTELFLARVLS